MRKAVGMIRKPLQESWCEQEVGSGQEDNWVFHPQLHPNSVLALKPLIMSSKQQKASLILIYLLPKRSSRNSSQSDMNHELMWVMALQDCGVSSLISEFFHSGAAIFPAMRRINPKQSREQVAPYKHKQIRFKFIPFSVCLFRTVASTLHSGAFSVVLHWL